MTRHGIPRPRNHPLVTVVAHTATAVGQCLIVAPTALGLTVATIAGVGTSCLVLRNRGRYSFGVFVPLVLATIVAASSYEAIRHGLVWPPLAPLAAALVTFPPGTALTTATLELAADGMVAAAGRGTLLIVVWLMFAAATVIDAALAGLPMLPGASGSLGAGTTWLGGAIFVGASVAYFRWPAWFS